MQNQDGGAADQLRSSVDSMNKEHRAISPDTRETYPTRHPLIIL
jgi:hypothetical protein